MPQDAESEAELRYLAAVPYQIISPANNAPIIGIYQDSMLGCYRFTRENIKFDAREAMNLLMMFERVNEVEFLKQVADKSITSFDLLTQIMPPLTLQYKTKLFTENDDAKTSNKVLEIKNGKYLRGQMDKGVLGGGTKGLIQRSCNDFGNMSASNFIDDLQNIITEYMKSSSFSVGISDLISNQKTNDSIVKVITDKKTDVKNLIDQTQLGVFENNTGKTNVEEFETQVNNILNQASSEAGKIGLKSLNKDNRFVIMVNAGSKGSELNISQMISCLGQQNVDGKRIPYGFEQRTLPHYSKFDDSPGARGFVESSYINGLSPQELFFHAMGGRVGLIDTAVKSVTWETPIVIIEHNQARYTEIGKWIDGQLDDLTNKDAIQHYTERQMELLNIKEGNVYIPTTDENGVVTWGPVTAITRHDPGTELYEIKTTGGRRVIVTESKSLLIWNSETKKLKEMPTPEIKVGDCVPVTRELCEPPIILEHVDLSQYLLKTEFVYGTEFNRALTLMNTTMENRKKIPEGWWNENNGSTFTLPYTKKSSLQRVFVRSNIENIKPGFVYPYGGNRKDAMIPEMFPLNKENGIFIGLFLAEGNVHKHTVCITNNDDTIRNFVKQWFEKNSIQWTERVRINKIGGTTSTVSAISTVLCTFLNKFVGSGAASKYVPSEAFIAPEEFIVGLLNGYYSGDGTISKNSIEAGSASYRLIEGISMLCSRIGVFGKIFKSQLKSNNLGTKNIKPTYRFAIRAQWGKRFAEKVDFLEANKLAKMKAIVWGEFHRNFDVYNDVVLDKITEINIIGVEDHPKVYDLTIPTTLNFGLANGLQVRDTSSTGYIQRRLIKGMEDLMVSYDMTIRTNKNKIVQFAYGEDSIDTVKVENQVLPIVSMSSQEIYAHYTLPDDAGSKNKALSQIFLKNTLARYKKQVEQTHKKCSEYIDFMLKVRDDIVKYVFKNKSDSVVNCPVAFSYIITNIQGQQGINSNSLVDITPLEAFEMIEQTYSTMESSHYTPPTTLFKTLYYYYLSPKDLLMVKRFNRAALVTLLQTVSVTYKRSIVTPGEMVGMTSGQSIGETSTQMTLNSVIYETEIITRNRAGIIQKVQIGDFIEKHIATPKKLEYYKENDTTYAEPGEYYEIPSCDEEGNIVWKEIEAVTRHPVINKDGTNTMLKITTDEEREVVATKAKSFLKLVNGKIIPVDGDSLKVGDYLPVSTKQIDFTESTELDLREIFPPTEYVYGSEVEKAKAVMHEYHWWTKHQDKTFTLPYRRSDSFVSKISEKLRNGCKSKTVLAPGCIYMKQTNMCDYTIPEKIPLNYNFGYLIGAYAAEGCMTKFQVSIANNDVEYFEPIFELCKEWNITTKVYRKEITDDSRINGTSQDVRIYNTVLCRILEKMCGKLSHNKFISDKIIFSNTECLKGFLDAYIGGDGCVSKKGKNIFMSSVSKNMLIDVQQILNILGIYSKIKTNKTSENTRFKVVHQCYDLVVRNKQAQKLAGMLNIKLKYKQDNLKDLLEHTYMYDLNKNYLTIPNEINGEIVFQKRTHESCNGVLFDKIKSIIEVPNTTKYAYDLTVKDTRTFNIYNGLAIEDTFHFAGVSSKSNVTRGVPRIEEILSLSSEPKNPSLTVYLKKEDETEREKAQTIMYMLEHTKLKEIVKSVEVCFDPDDMNTLISEDKTTMEQYREFERMVDDCMPEEDLNKEDEKSKWVVRMEMDPTIMLEKNITMDDVNFTLRNGYGDDVSCVYSDYNADKLVFRVRMKNVMKNSSNKSGTKKQVNSLDQSDQIYILKNFQDNLLENTVLRGIKRLNKVILRKIKDNVVESDGVYKKKDIWVLDTIGTNMMDILALDYIDASRTFSNDIVEIYVTLGIEAARQAIFNEITEVIEFDGTYINYHHFSILCDRMTSTSKMISIFRHGINNDNIGPIAKASFEETPQMFLMAAKHAELDTFRGVSANVMCGQEGYYGTSAFQVILDIEEMSTLEEAIKYEQPDDEQEAIEKMFGEVDSPDAACSTSKLAIQNNVVSIKSADMGADNNYNPF